MNASVLILTFNEEGALPACLAALQGCDDVVVLDSGSTDDTRRIAEGWGARVIVRRFDTFAAQRNFALDTVPFRNPWVLHLDADEIVTPALRRELENLGEDERFHAYRIPSRMMFMDSWLKHSGCYPVYQVRLGRADRLRFVQAGHGQRENVPEHEVGTIDEPYLHYSFAKGLSDWFERQNRYSSDEARRAMELRSAGRWDVGGLLAFSNRVRRRRALKDAASTLPCRGVCRFLELYLIRLGFLDGAAGLRYCRLVAIYEQMMAAKMAYERHLVTRRTREDPVPKPGISS